MAHTSSSISSFGMKAGDVCWYSKDGEPDDLFSVELLLRMCEVVLLRGFTFASSGLKQFIEAQEHLVNIIVSVGYDESEVLLRAGRGQGPDLIEIARDDIRRLVFDLDCSIYEATVSVAADQVAEYLTRLSRFAFFAGLTLEEHQVDVDVLKKRFTARICDAFSVPQLVSSDYVG